MTVVLSSLVSPHALPGFQSKHSDYTSSTFIPETSRNGSFDFWPQKGPSGGTEESKASRSMDRSHAMSQDHDSRLPLSPITNIAADTVFYETKFYQGSTSESFRQSSDSRGPDNGNRKIPDSMFDSGYLSQTGDQEMQGAQADSELTVTVSKYINIAEFEPTIFHIDVESESTATASNFPISSAVSASISSSQIPEPKNLNPKVAIEYDSNSNPYDSTDSDGETNSCESTNRLNNNSNVNPNTISLENVSQQRDVDKNRIMFENFSSTIDTLGCNIERDRISFKALLSETEVRSAISTLSYSLDS